MLQTGSHVMTHAMARVHDSHSGDVNLSHGTPRQGGLKSAAPFSTGPFSTSSIFAMPSRRSGQGVSKRPADGGGLKSGALFSTMAFPGGGCFQGSPTGGLLQGASTQGPATGRPVMAAFVGAHRWPLRTTRPCAHVLLAGGLAWRRLDLRASSHRGSMSWHARAHIEARGAAIPREGRGDQISRDIARAHPAVSRTSASTWVPTYSACVSERPTAPRTAMRGAWPSSLRGVPHRPAISKVCGPLASLRARQIFRSRPRLATRHAT